MQSMLPVPWSRHQTAPPCPPSASRRARPRQLRVASAAARGCPWPPGVALGRQGSPLAMLARTRCSRRRPRRFGSERVRAGKRALVGSRHSVLGNRAAVRRGSVLVFFGLPLQQGSQTLISGRCLLGVCSGAENTEIER